MKKWWKHSTKVLTTTTVVTCSVFVIIYFSSWGFSPHRELHAVAITALPSPVFGFFKTHQHELMMRSVDADKRKHGVKEESAKHYIDLDHYAKGISPCGWYEACELYSEDTLIARGILPWSIERVYNQLIIEMSNCGVQDSSAANLTRVLKLSADLGHYIGDAHVPLHTSSNYNGQLTGQNGIHALWETHVYETSRPYWIGQRIEAVYIPDIRNWVWSRIMSSHSKVKEVLYMERVVREREGAPDVWGYRTRGRTLSLIPTPGFCEEYNDSLGGMVEERFYMAAEGIASVWYSAWVDAGAPDLHKDLIKPKKRNAISELVHFFQEQFPNQKELVGADPK